MNHVRTLLIASALAGAATLGPVATRAQNPATTAPAPAVAAPTEAGTMPPRTGKMSGVVEQRIAAMHTRLKITAAQQSQWDQFASVMRDNAASMDRAFEQRVQGIQTMNAADNMKSYATIATEHAQDMQKLADSFGTLYASLSPEQRTAADQYFRTAAERHVQQRMQKH